VGTQGSFGGGIVSAQVLKTARNGRDGTRDGVAGPTYANSFARHSVLLVRKHEGCKGSVKHLINGCSSGIQLEGAMVQMGIAIAKGATAVCAGGVFARATDEEETDQKHVAQTGISNIVCTIADLNRLDDDEERDGSYTIGWWVLLFPMCDNAGDASINFALVVQAYIRGPQLFERFANLARDVLHCSSTNWISLEGNAAVPISEHESEE
jgi:hypothetical protein